MLSSQYLIFFVYIIKWFKWQVVICIKKTVFDSNGSKEKVLITENVD